MTKEKIIKLCEKYINNKNGFMATSFADELLTLFKQELLERLEQLHTEMDERMREEVAIEKRMGEQKAEKLINQIEELTTGKCALRCPLVEQARKEEINKILQESRETICIDISKPFYEECKVEIENAKKEVAREILNDLRGLLEGYIHTNENITLYEYYCKKYGVEL